MAEQQGQRKDAYVYDKEHHIIVEIEHIDGDGQWAGYELSLSDAVEGLNNLAAENEQLRAVARDLAAELRDCIAEVEGKAYLKPYVKAGYEEVLARADALTATKPSSAGVDTEGSE